MRRKETMTNLRTSIELIGLFLSVAVLSSGQVSPTVKQIAKNSPCANIVALSGAKVDCSNLTPAQKKALDSIPSILKLALTDQDYLDAIMRKLDEISRVPMQPNATNNAPGGFAVSGGTLINPQVTNLGPPDPKIENFEIVPAVPSSAPNENPMTAFRFSLSAPLSGQKFIAICSRPCTARNAMASPPPSMV